MPAKMLASKKDMVALSWKPTRLRSLVRSNCLLDDKELRSRELFAEGDLDEVICACRTVRSTSSINLCSRT